MSRRSVRWEREVRKAGGDITRILPQKAHSDGRKSRYLCAVDADGYWYVKEALRGVATAKRCCVQMRAEKLERIIARHQGKKR